jgi:hypothetical protein
MVKKLTVLELHLDDARFSNMLPGRTVDDDEATADVDATDDVDAADDIGAAPDADEESSGGRGLARRIGMLAFMLGLAVGIRMALRRFRSVEEDEAAETLEDAGVSVDVDEPIDA